METWPLLLTAEPQPGTQALRKRAGGLEAQTNERACQLVSNTHNSGLARPREHRPSHQPGLSEINGQSQFILRNLTDIYLHEEHRLLKNTTQAIAMTSPKQKGKL